jgi:hypothetical protein
VSSRKSDETGVDTFQEGCMDLAIDGKAGEILSEQTLTLFAAIVDLEQTRPEGHC